MTHKVKVGGVGMRLELFRVMKCEPSFLVGRAARRALEKVAKQERQAAMSKKKGRT